MLRFAEHGCRIPRLGEVYPQTASFSPSCSNSSAGERSAHRRAVTTTRARRASKAWPSSSVCSARPVAAAVAMIKRSVALLAPPADRALAIDVHSALWLLDQGPKSGHGLVAHGDRELLARLRAPEDLTDVVAQLPLRYPIVRHSCYGL